MSVFALLSAGGSPGVTTSALALTLSWPSQVILAECDPSGGDVLAGLLRGHLSASSGLLPLALEVGAGAEIPPDTLWRQLIELDEEHNRLLLAGISDPRQSAALQSSLPWIAEALQGIQGDVIADCGRLDAVAAVRPVLSAASLAVLVLQPTLRQVSRAMPRIEMLTNLVGRDRVVILLVGEGTAPGREVARALGLPVAGQLPDDLRTAAVLSDGSGRRHRLEARPLIRAATIAGRGLREAAEAAGPLRGYASQVVYSDPGPAQSGIVQSGTVHPGTGQASFDQPSFDQPSFDQPSFGQAGLGQPGFGQSGFGQSGSTGPNHYAAGHSSIGQSGNGQSGIGRPAFSEPDPGQPEFSQPDPGPREFSQPDLSEPGLPRRGRHSLNPLGLDQPSHEENGHEENGHGEPALGRLRFGRFTLGPPDGAQPGNGQHGTTQNGSRP